VIDIAKGIASNLIGLLMVAVVVAIVRWVATSVKRRAVAPIVISVLAAVAVVWVMWCGGLEYLVGKTETEVAQVGNRGTPDTIPFDFGQ